MQRDYRIKSASKLSMNLICSFKDVKVSLFSIIVYLDQGNNAMGVNCLHFVTCNHVLLQPECAMHVECEYSVV